MHVDLVIPVAGQGVFLSGWYYEIPGTVQQVSCRAGVYEFRMDGTWLRTARADVSTHLSSSRIASSHHNHGFGCFVPLPEAHAPYYIAITFTDGTVQRMGLPLPSPATALQNVRTVLTAFPPACRELRRCLDEHVGPAVRGIWQSRPRLQPSLIIDRFGAAPAHPRVSIIVPLYGRHDLADYQLALFADDPDLQNAELIYVVDDPAIYDEFRALCAGLYEIHRVPFTLAYAGVNLGFAGATNCGASIARAGRLLLLNSDVLPKQPGWLGKLLSVFESLEAPGPLGVKLLFEDGGLQHAGMAFRRYAPWDGLWINDHPQKGHSASGLTGVRTVDAVTAACMLVETALYRELGGLSEDYVIGDFEDSDFCLRAAAAGHRSRVALDVELYHLERQSQNLIGDAQWRANLTLYNCWQHNLRWAAQIEALQ
jgi:GT2 family glycosyltransferase